MARTMDIDIRIERQEKKILGFIEHAPDDDDYWA
jgi:hypothetical protein